MIRPPLPGSETDELSYLLVAMIVAKTGLPHGRLKGALLRTETGTEQCGGVMVKKTC